MCLAGVQGTQLRGAVLAGGKQLPGLCLLGGAQLRGFVWCRRKRCGNTRWRALLLARGYKAAGTCAPWGLHSCEDLCGAQRRGYVRGENAQSPRGGAARHSVRPGLHGGGATCPRGVHRFGGMYLAGVQGQASSSPGSPPRRGHVRGRNAQSPGDGAAGLSVCKGIHRGGATCPAGSHIRRARRPPGIFRCHRSVAAGRFVRQAHRAAGLSHQAAGLQPPLPHLTPMH